MKEGELSETGLRLEIERTVKTVWERDLRLPQKIIYRWITKLIKTEY